MCVVSKARQNHCIFLEGETIKLFLDSKVVVYGAKCFDYSSIERILKRSNISRHPDSRHHIDEISSFMENIWHFIIFQVAANSFTNCLSKLCYLWPHFSGHLLVNHQSPWDHAHVDCKALLLHIGDFFDIFTNSWQGFLGIETAIPCTTECWSSLWPVFNFRVRLCRWSAGVFLLGWCSIGTFTWFSEECAGRLCLDLGPSHPGSSV